MAVKVVKIPHGTFSANPYLDLEARLEIGVVIFRYITATDAAAAGKGVLREAWGTRNLTMSFVPFSEIPYGGRVVPPHVTTYYDLDRDAWRCFRKDHLVDYGEEIYIEY